MIAEAGETRGLGLKVRAEFLLHATPKPRPLRHFLASLFGATSWLHFLATAASPVRMLARLRSIILAPMPLTLLRSSAVLKPPFFSR